MTTHTLRIHRYLTLLPDVARVETWQLEPAVLADDGGTPGGGERHRIPAFLEGGQRVLVVCVGKSVGVAERRRLLPGQLADERRTVGQLRLLGLAIQARQHRMRFG